MLPSAAVPHLQGRQGSPELGVLGAGGRTPETEMLGEERAVGGEEGRGGWGWGGVAGSERQRLQSTRQRGCQQEGEVSGGQRWAAVGSGGQWWSVPCAIGHCCAQQLLREKFLTVLGLRNLIFMAESTSQKFNMANPFDPRCKKMLLLGLAAYSERSVFSESCTTFAVYFYSEQTQMSKL